MKDKILIVIILLISIPTVSSLVRSGYFPMHDDMQAMRLLQLEKCIGEGQIPCRWVPDMGYGYGYPQFSYYGPIPYYVMYLFRLLGFSILGSVKGFVLAATTIGVIGMYLLGKDLWGRMGGVVSAIVFVYAPYRAFDIYVRGAMGELFAISLAPLLFWAAKRVLDKKRFSMGLFAVIYSTLLTSHNISTLIYSVAVAVWVLALILLKNSKFGEKIRDLLNILLGFFWGLLLAAYFILPAFLEKKYVHVETLLLGYFDYRRHFVSLKQLLLNTFWGYGSSELGIYDGSGYAVGVVLWTLPIIIFLLMILLKKKRKREIIYLCIFITLGWAGLFMSHLKSSFIWERISILTYFQFPWRFLMISTIVFSAAAGAINLLFKKRRQQFLFIGGLVILLAILYGNYFSPSEWMEINDKQKFSGESWEKQMTISIYDYLPIYAKYPPGERAPMAPQIVDGDAFVMSYEKGTDWSIAVVEVESERALIREPWFYFPYWRAFSDGQELMIDHNNDLGLITYELAQGKHEIRLKLYDTGIRKMSNLISFFAWGIIPVYFIIVRKDYEKSN